MLLILMPLLMLYRGRYCQPELTGTVIVRGKKLVIYLGLLFGAALLVGSVLLKFY
jgi:hypothetical protein